MSNQAMDNALSVLKSRIGQSLAPTEWFERAAAARPDFPVTGVDWYEACTDWLLDHQNPNGSWTGSAM